MTPVLARRLMVAALALGVLGNWVLRADYWRLGFLLWVSGLAIVALLSTPAGTEADPRRPREHRLLAGSAIAIASLFVLRDAELLYVVDFFALVVVAALIAWRASGRALVAVEPRDAIAGGLGAVATAIAGAPALALRDAAPLRIVPEDRRTLGGVAIGTFVAAPILLIVTALLAQADPLFAGFVENAADLLDAGLVGHIAGILLASWIAAGALRGSLVPILGGIPMPSVLATRVGFPVFAPLLGGLAVLLSAWIGLQVRVLFGGAGYVIATSGVTVAEYARRGFFELIVVAGIVLGSLLVADDLLERGATATRRSFRALGIVLVGLVAVLLTSAVQRLALYVSHFGLTDDRVLALAILVWVAAVLGWFAWTVLREARHRFAPGVLLLSAGWLVALNAANPERRVVETNLRRAEQGKEFDVAYHAKLSGDAVPALVAGAARLGPAREAEVREALRVEWAKRGTGRDDWRAWSLPYLRALRLTSSVPPSGTGPATGAR